jgi:hypothetical protein
MPGLVRGAEVLEASLSDRAGTSLLVCIRSLCGTKPNGFRHRAYIIAPAASVCRGYFCGICPELAAWPFHFGTSGGLDPRSALISVRRGQDQVAVRAA